MSLALNNIENNFCVNRMGISVIIPTYRPKDYLWQCLRSVANQTIDKSQMEVIIVLNGCAEPWQTQIQTFIDKEMKDIQVRLLQTDTPGVSNARNIGIEAARGEYISFVDDDDWLSAVALEEMSKLVSSNAIVCCDVQCVHPTTKAVSTDYLHDSYLRNKNTRASLWSARSYFSTSCCKLIPKDVIATTRFDCRFAVGEDSLFMSQLAYRVQNIRFAPASAIYFRRLSLDSASRKQRTLAWRFKQFWQLNNAYLWAWLKHPCVDPRFPLSRIVGTWINFVFCYEK